MSHSAVDGPSPERHTWMDLFRGVAVVLVAAGHSADDTTSRPIRLGLEAMGDYRIPALLLLSGILLPRSLEKPASVYLEGKARRILWPYLVWAAIMIPIFGLENALSPRWWLLGEPSHVWYLHALLMYYLLALATRRVPPIWIALAMLALSVPSAALADSGDPPGLIWNRPWYGIFFFLGAAIEPHLARIIGLPRWVSVIAAVVTAGWMARTVQVGHAEIGGVLPALAAAVGLLLVVWVAPRVPRVGVVRAVEWMGRSSIVIYLVHFPAMFAWHQIGFDADGVLDYLIMFALTLGAGVGAVVLRPWPAVLYELPRRRPRARVHAGEAREPGPV